ncbi:hypothetical protein [Streptomyces sp. TS71-3]|uniref:hypothetical protein n=1 Tax=Streptomyces sp. TS71-3 TaxID=2733862 RepID=UPI001B07ACFD|nr:hypothetical protein [Streptomyces sp. TS71-3]GHJ39934.1 hypothetical protein Sm713_55430 [Streptomyces sp. TS71-3]
MRLAPRPRSGSVRATAATALAAALTGALLWPAPAGAAPAPAPRDPAPPVPAPATYCAPADRHGAGLCVTVAGAAMTVSAFEPCRCRVSGTWQARAAGRGGAVVASGALAGRADYPGPGTYDITATAEARTGDGTAPAVRRQVRGTFTLTAAKPPVTRRIEVHPRVVRPGRTTTLTYTVSRTGDGDSSARVGMIGQESSGIVLASTDGRCVNPLTGRYPSTARDGHALDCALTDVQPGRPARVVVHVTLGRECSTIVSMLGYWAPAGQNVTGGMIAGPTVTCSR